MPMQPSDKVAAQSETPTETTTCQSFQHTVSSCLIRHRSILDIISKFQEANARVNRAIIKAVTACGCIRIEAEKQPIPTHVSVWEMREHMDTHVQGEPCEACREVIEQEVGRNLFYLTAVCDVFSLKLENVIERERGRLATLGVFNLM